MQLTEVISDPSGSRDTKDAREKKPKDLDESPVTRENPAFSDKDEA